MEDEVKRLMDIAQRMVLISANPHLSLAELNTIKEANEVIMQAAKDAAFDK